LVTFKIQIDLLNYFDLIVGVGLLYGAIKGFSRGLVVEVASIVALILGVWGALSFSEQFMELVHLYVSLPEKYGKLIIYFVLFVGIVYGVSWVAKVTTKVLKIVALGLLNRLAGAAFGIGKWALIFSALILVLLEINSVFTLVPEAVLESSMLYAPLKQLGESLFQWAMTQDLNGPVEQITGL
jgi:membrane protein required for colicin V production